MTDTNKGAIWFFVIFIIILIIASYIGEKNVPMSDSWKEKIAQQEYCAVNDCGDSYDLFR